MDNPEGKKMCQELGYFTKEGIQMAIEIYEKLLNFLSHYGMKIRKHNALLLHTHQNS